MLRICSLLVLIVAGAAQADVRGAARVIDGDTLAVAGTTIRLFGIDAPERTQGCEVGGRSWPCGIWAGQQLARLIDGQPVSCAGRDTDRYGRMVARCTGPGGDLGAAMVEQGAALAYRRYGLDYVGQEERARRAQRGLWGSDGLQTQDPAAFRAAGRADGGETQSAPAGCVIKGNISASGRIYHRPGQRDYDRTRIDPVRGERWFCSEAEARAAGWRAARR